MVDESEILFGGGGDLVVATLEVDGGVGVDAALLALGKVEIEQGRDGPRAKTMVLSEQRLFPDGERDEASAALAGEISAAQFHLKHLRGVDRGGFSGPVCLYRSRGMDAPLSEVGEDANDKFGRQPDG